MDKLPNWRMTELQRKNYELSISEYQSAQTVLACRPVAVFVELTQGCNLSCAMCRSNFIGVKGNSMSNELFDLLATELFPTAALVDLRGWGESLILRDIDKRIECVIHYGCKIRFVTNLSFKRDAVIAKLKEVGALLDVSLDGCSQQTLDVTRRGARYDLIKRNLESLTSVAHPNPNLSLNVTVQRGNVAELPAIVRFAASLGIQRIKLASVTAPQGSNLRVDAEAFDIPALVSQIHDEAEQTGVTVTASNRVLGLDKNDYFSEPTCIHPWMYCNIDYLGNVGFCDHLIGPDCESYFVGNIEKSSFVQIWNSEPMINVRKEHLGSRSKNAPKFAHCSWCYHNKYIDFEDTIIPCSENSVARI